MTAISMEQWRNLANPGNPPQEMNYPPPGWSPTPKCLLRAQPQSYAGLLLFRCRCHPVPLVVPPLPQQHTSGETSGARAGLVVFFPPAVALMVGHHANRGGGG